MGYGSNGIQPTGRPSLPNAVSAKGAVESLRPGAERPEVHALQEENARLRVLVTQLSELIIKNSIETLHDK